MYQDWRALQYFHAIADKGAILHAAEELGVSATTLRSALSQLEKKIGGTLFRRTHRGIVLTDRGTELFAQTSQIRDITKNLDAENIDAAEQRPQCRVTCTEFLYRTIFAGALMDALQAIGNIDLIVFPDDNVLNLNDDEVDISLRAQQPSQESFIANRIGELHSAIYVPKEMAGDFSQLIKLPLVLPNRNLGVIDNLSPPHRQLLDQFKQHIFVPSLGYAQELMRSGKCVGVMPVLREADTPHLVRFETGIAVPPIELWICRKRLANEQPVRKKVYGALRAALATHI